MRAPLIEPIKRSWRVAATDSKGTTDVKAWIGPGRIVVRFEDDQVRSVAVPIDIALWLMGPEFRAFVTDPRVQPFLYSAVTEGRIRAADQLALYQRRKAFADALTDAGLTNATEAWALAKTKFKD
jgi:hypothetical protein